MTNATGEASQSGAVFWRLYMLGWVGLAGAALIYLSAAVLRPDLLKPLIVQTAAKSVVDKDVVSTKLDTLERSLNSLENKIANVESEVRKVATMAPAQTSGEMNKDEEAIAAAPAVAQSVAPGGVAPVQVGSDQQSTDKTVVASSGKVPPLPARAPRRQKVAGVSTTEGQEPAIPLVILNGVAAAGISTGSVDSALKPAIPNPQISQNQLPEVIRAEPTVKQERPNTAIAFGKPTVEAAQSIGTSNAIVVSVAGSVDKLRSDWDLLLAKHPQLLRNLQPRYDIMAANGPYRLLAGPLINKSEAGQLCSVLQLHGVTCDVEDNFLGNAL